MLANGRVVFGKKGDSMRRKFLTVLGCALLLAGLNRTAQAQSINQLIVFGDSLSDNGNLFALTGIPPAPYYQGRGSNGPVWVEYLANRLGAPLDDRAYFGAHTDTGSTVPGGPGIRTSVDVYLATHAAADPNALYILQGGTEDYVDGQTNPAIPVGNLAGELTDLAARGARNFLVMNLPNLGETPLVRGTPLAGPATQLSQTNNALLSGALNSLQGVFPDAQFTLLDVYAFQQEVLANPGAFGFTNVTDGYLINGVGDPNNYLYWDAGHPTTAAHRLLADFAYAAVVPEPSALTFLAGLAVFMGCWKVGTRRGWRCARRT